MKRWLVSVMVLGLFGCGSIKIRDVNEAEVMKVRRIAVASVAYSQPNASTVLGTGSHLVAQESEEVTQSLKDIGLALSKNMHWAILPVEEMRGNPAYKKAYESKMKGFQNKGPINGTVIIAPGVMDDQSIRRMRPAERDQLMEALKVDALMETTVNIVFASKGVAVMGFGSRHPQAYISLRMYKRGVEAPVWFDGRIAGDASDVSVGSTGFFDPNEVTRLGRLSVKSAFDKINLKTQ